MWVFYSELWETPFASEVANGSTQSTQGWFFILDICIGASFNFEDMDGALVGCRAHVFVQWVNAYISDYGLISASSVFWELLARECVEESDERSFIGCGRQYCSILRKLHGCYTRGVTSGLDHLFVIIEENDFHAPYGFVGKCEHTVFLIRRQTHQPLGIGASQIAVRQFEVLKVVDVQFLFKNHNDSELQKWLELDRYCLPVFSQFHIEHVSLKVQFPERPVLDIVPQDQSRWWVARVVSSSDKADDVGPEKHLA